jgi:hypothetical protein
VASTPGIVITPADVVATQRGLSEVGVDQPQLLAVEVQLSQQRPRGGLFVARQVLPGEPGPALVAEQVRCRAARDQVPVQDRVHLVLQPGALPHQVRPAQHLPAQRVRGRVRQPHRRQVVRGQQPRQNLRVDLVGLHLRLGDRPGLGRIRHHHPAGPTRQQRRDRPRVPGRLQRHLIARAEAVGEPAHLLRRGREPARLHHHAGLPHRHLRELPMHIQPDTPPPRRTIHHRSPPTTSTAIGSGWAKRHLRIRAHSATGQVAGAATY